MPIPETTLGKFLIDQALPPEMRGRNLTLTGKNIQALLQEVADHYPDQYSKVAKELSDIGREATTRTGSFSSGVESRKTSNIAKQMRQEFGQELEGIYGSNMPEEEKNALIIRRAGEWQARLSEEVYKEALDSKNPLAMMVASGMRGSKTNINSLLGADMLYTDHNNQAIPIPVLHNYSEGLTGAEYFAGAFGARKGIIDLKCLVFDTLVLMADGTAKRIADIQVGDQVVAVDKSGGHKAVKVLNVFDNGKKACYRTTWKNADKTEYTLESTLDHKILGATEHLITNEDGAQVKVAVGSVHPVSWFVKTHSIAAHRSRLVDVKQLDADGVIAWCGNGFHMPDVLRFSSKKLIGYKETFDIEVDHPDHLFVLANGLVVSNSATQDAGFFAKQLTQAAHRLVVTDEDEREPDETTVRGLPVDTDDKFNVGALLAHPAGGYPRNTVLTAKILQEIKSSGAKKILVRSPAVGGPSDGGVYARDVGIREKARLPSRGDYVGIAGAQAVAEPITQSQISSKHCAAKGTLVRMFDGTIKPIEDIVVGDEVVGCDLYGNPADGPTKVVAVYNNGLRCCSRYTLQDCHRHGDGLVIQETLTPDHKVLKDNTVLPDFEQAYWPTPMGNWVVGDWAKALAVEVLGNIPWYSHCYEPKLTHVEDAGELETYDIEVDHPDHLFLLASGLIVSNSGGVAGASAGAIQGFPLFNAMVQSPKNFPGGATHAQADGTIDSIQEAPQGGFNVLINNQKHYVPAGFPLKVKQGDHIEAGDVLSEGTPSPGEIVKHKGVGEGRRYFTKAFLSAMQNANTKADRRNVELLSRGLINHVKLTEEYNSNMPDDVVPYQYLEANWEPRPGHVITAPSQAKGQYLERPVLHYSVGTPLRPSVIKELDEFGIKNVYTHKDPPPFEPTMIRAMAHANHDDDWMTRMIGSYQKDSLLSAVHRGDTSDTAGSSYVPALAERVNFGDHMKPPVPLTPPATLKGGTILD